MSLETTHPTDVHQADQHTVAQVASLLKQALEHQRWKQLDDAERLATEALSLARQELGETHITTAYARTDLAIIQEDQNKPVEARDNLIAALEILEPALGHHHGQVTMIFTRLHHLFM